MHTIPNPPNRLSYSGTLITAYLARNRYLHTSYYPEYMPDSCLLFPMIRSSGQLLLASRHTNRHPARGTSMLPPLLHFAPEEGAMLPWSDDHVLASINKL